MFFLLSASITPELSTGHFLPYLRGVVQPHSPLPTFIWLTSPLWRNIPCLQTRPEKREVYYFHIPVRLLCGTYCNHRYVIIFDFMNVVVVTPGPEAL